MSTELLQLVQADNHSRDAVTQRTREIYERLLVGSKYVDSGNFRTIHPDDLKSLFDSYDELFFRQRLRSALANAPLAFRFSKKMTQAAGRTARRELRSRTGHVIRVEYEIAISSTLLFYSFDDAYRQISVNGIECRDRLTALQRVFEHELIHLAEMLVWNESSCSGRRFQSIAERLFGHSEHTHRLITPREKAITQFGIRPGDRVAFRLDGQHHVGRVNRITKRATVLVEDARGVPYSDGKFYRKFYVPISMLQPVVTPEAPDDPQRGEGPRACPGRQDG